MSESDFNEFILSTMPHFIAVNYQRLLDAEMTQKRVEVALHIYNLGVRALTIGLVSQYLIRDREQISDSYLNQLLLNKFAHLTLDSWTQLFFATLQAYEGNRERFFMPELYDFYWDRSTLPHTRRAEVERPFKRLTQITFEMKEKPSGSQHEASWQALANETQKLLLRFLRGMSFLAKYDLIRILDHDNDFYRFELHKGVKVNKAQQRCPPYRYPSLNQGWFYLRKESGELLLLHPFFVFWEEEAPVTGLLSSDTGVYERFVYERLQYLLTTLGKTVVDDSSIQAFVTVLYDTIEEVKRNRQQVETLTWWQLRDTCADITQKRMATVQNKYRPELYLQRDKSRMAFENFLKSDKRCFVLIGKSGVGKSNFLLALGKEFHKSNSDICALMYDGANLNVKPSITEVIGRDFEDRVTIVGRQIKEVWREIAQIDEIDERRVILYVDAINENPQAKELLKQLDELVQKPWPWLKVVFSSRPETWHAVKHGVRLAEALYYREQGAEKVGVELEPFSYSEQMDPFSRQELPAVYAKYQQAFDLQTAYDALPGGVRQMLRDPLSLLLVAQSYEGKAIPSTVNATELIERYLNALRRSERLREQDLRFLTKQLVPLMVNFDESHYSNTISIADIDRAGDELYQKVYSEQLLSDGQRVNQSFTNLLDAQILARQEEGRDQRIYFKYERFFDYFVGQYLFEKYQKSPDKVAFFEELVGHLKEKLFLWGVLRNLLEQLLIDHLKQGEEALIERVGETKELFQADLMISVLIDHYREYEIELKSILLRWLENKDQESQAPRITVNVAIACLIEEILERILVDPNDSLRSFVVQEIHELWQRDRELTTRLLHRLASKVSRLRIKSSFKYLNSLLSGSLLLVLSDYSNVGGASETVKVVQNVWKPVIEKLLLVNPVAFIERRMKRPRRSIIRAFMGLTVGFLRNLERDGFTFSFKDVEAFFPVSEHKKQIMKRLIPHLDAGVGQAPESVESLSAYIEEVARNRDDNMMIFYTGMCALIAHIKADPLRTAQALDKVLENLATFYQPPKSLAESTASFWYPIITYSFLNLSYVDMEPEVAKQILEIFMKGVRTRQFRYRDRWRFGCGATSRVSCMEGLLFGYALDIPEVGREMLKEIVLFQIDKGDHEQIKWAPSSIAIGMERYKLPDAGVAALYDFIVLLKETGYFDKISQKERPLFWQKAADDLIKHAGGYHEHLVDLIEKFEEGELPEAFTVRIRGASSLDSIAKNTAEAITWAFSSGLQDKKPFVRDFLKWLFSTTLEVDSAVELALEITIYLLESVYNGEPLFS